MTITPLHGLRRADRAVLTARSRLTVTTTSGGPTSAGRVTLRVTGEVDACNAKEFAVAVCEAAAGHDDVDLDLRALGFAGVDAISALHAINAYMTRHETAWLVLPGPAVSRLLDLCDPEALIPRLSADPGIAAEPA